MTIYIAELHMDETGIGFTIDDLPGFSAHYEGTDLVEAEKVAEAVLRDWIASNVDRGIAIPAPTPAFEVDRRLRAANPNGFAWMALRARFPAGRTMRINLSIDERTLAEIDHKASVRGLTRSAFMVEAARAFD